MLRNIYLQKMTPKISFEDLESRDYQVGLFNERVSQKLTNRNLPVDQHVLHDNRLLFVEHPHVYTLGKSGNQNNLLIDSKFLNKINATYYHIDRGGDITYHGPGQIVGYPIFDLEQFGMHIKQYVYSLEQSIINTLAEFGIEGSRLTGATGVWLDPETPTARKISAIGVKASRQITMHGFAFNVNTDLTYFNYINPCGYQDKGVTSLSKELNCKQDMAEVKKLLKQNIISVFSKSAAKMYF
jgi:lipoyl(octanoyl) transferase